MNTRQNNPYNYKHPFCPPTATREPDYTGAHHESDYHKESSPTNQSPCSTTPVGTEPIHHVFRQCQGFMIIPIAETSHTGNELKVGEIV